MRDLELIVVEDDPMAQTIYIDALTGTGCHASFCSTVSSALNLASTINPDVIIMDLGLPDGSGVDAIKRITSAGLCSNILVATASQKIAEHQAAMDAGADLVLVKPIDQDELHRRILSFSGSAN